MSKVAAVTGPTHRQSESFFSGNVSAIAFSSGVRSLGGFVGVYLPLYFVQIGGKPLTLGLLTSAASVFQFLTLSMGGFIADYYGRKKIMVLAALYSAFLTAMYALALDWRLFGLLTVFAAAGTIANPATHATVADSISPEKRTTGIAALQVVSALPSVVSPLIGGWLIQRYDLEQGFRIACVCAAVFALVSSIPLLVLLKETLKSKVSANPGFNLRESVLESLKPSRLMLSASLKFLLASYALVVLANAAVAQYYILYAISVVGLTGFDWGVVVSMQFLLACVLKIPGGWLSDRFGKKKVMTLSLLATVPVILMFTLSRTVVQLVASALLLVAAGIYYAPAHEALQADLAHKSMRGRITAAWDMSSAAATALGTLVGGFAFQMLGPAVPFYIFSVAELLAAILLVSRVKEPDKKEV